MACCNTGDRPWTCAHCADAPNTAPTVFLLDDMSIVHEIVVPPQAVDDILPFLSRVTGIEYFEARNFMSGDNADVFNPKSCMLVSVYLNEHGQCENERNVGASQILGFPVFGNAVVVCSEEMKGDDNGDGALNKVCAIKPFLHSLQERGKGIPVYEKKIITHKGPVGDVMHKIKLTCEKDPYAGIPVHYW